MRLLLPTFVALLAGPQAFALSVSLFTPTNGAVIPAGEITVHALPIDSNYPIRRVEFFRNGVALGEATNVPFSVTIDDHPPGNFKFWARAQNSRLESVESEPVVVRVGNPPTQVVRGPYLQSGSPTGMVIRWRTDWFTDSVVRYGTNTGWPDQALTNAGAKVDHEMAVTGLQPDTRYNYSVGSSTQTLTSGSNCYFRTSPVKTRPVRLWVIGDSGSSDARAASVRDAYQAVTGGAETDLWLMLGDNAYSDGLDHQFQTAVFDMYPDLLRHTVLWPTLGNHDAGDEPGPAGNQGRFHLGAFTLPQQGESGGLPSGTELYYSFDYANIHAVCLDSFLSDNSPLGPMLTWLKNDLAATEKDWILAFWHYPPYTRSTHDSDGELSLARMREHVLPILEDYGVDLVLCGHSHSYERSFLLDGHYGYSWTLQPEMILDGGYGRPHQDGAYLKPAGGLGEHRGCVYAVCGCSGEGGASEGFPLHSAMKLNHGGYGSMIIQIDGLRLDAQFLRPSGVVDDHFTIDKSVPATLRPNMEIMRNTNSVMISWPTSHPAFELETAPGLPANQWSMVAPAQTRGRRNYVTLPATNEGQFFQLRRQP